MNYNFVIVLIKYENATYFVLGAKKKRCDDSTTTINKNKYDFKPVSKLKDGKVI